MAKMVIPGASAQSKCTYKYIEERRGERDEREIEELGLEMRRVESEREE